MSSIIRILIGLGLIIFSWTVYQKNAAAIAAGAPVNIGGYASNATPGQVAMGFGAIGVIGAAFVILGVVGLLKQKR